MIIAAICLTIGALPNVSLPVSNGLWSGGDEKLNSRSEGGVVGVSRRDGVDQFGAGRLGQKKIIDKLWGHEARKACWNERSTPGGQNWRALHAHSSLFVPVMNGTRENVPFKSILYGASGMRSPSTDGPQTNLQ